MLLDTLFIVNPISGNGRKERIVAEIRRRGGKVVFTEHAGHAIEIARDAGESRVVAVGGDGTVNEVARGLYGSDKTLGIIPCGSGDGLALHLGISRDFRKALKVIEGGASKEMDCAEIAGHPFFSISGVGLDADVSESFAKSGHRGLLTYIKEALSTWKKFKPRKYVLTLDGETREVEAVLISVGNSNQWGNEAKITPLADCSDGFLDVTILSMFHDIDVPVLAERLMTGHIHKDPHVQCLRAKEITISCSEKGPAHFDGDWFDAPEQIEIKVLPKKLKVMVP